MEEKYINLAIKEAQKAYYYNEIPVGAVIVKNGVIISKAHNKKETSNLVFNHAEIIAISKANKKLHSWRLDDCIIYTTLFPCPMCASAIQQSRIKKIVYITDTNNDYVFQNSISILNSSKSNHRVEISKYSLNSNLIDDFFLKLRRK